MSLYLNWKAALRYPLNSERRKEFRRKHKNLSDAASPVTSIGDSYKQLVRKRIPRVALSLPGLGPVAKGLEAEVGRLTEEATHLVSEVVNLTAEREALEVQLYEIRRAQQEQLEEGSRFAKMAAVMEAQYAKMTATMEAQYAQLTATIDGNSAKLAADAETYYAKLAGQLTLSSSETSSSLRVALQSRAGKPIGDSQRYLDLLEKALTGQLFDDEPISPWSGRYDASVRMVGRDWSGKALTMIGVARMRNIRELAERVIDEGVPGDFLEAGVWRGGACIYMRGILAAHRETERVVWVADSFAGLPPPDSNAYPADKSDTHHQFHQLAVPLDEVRSNFARYGFLDAQVRFLPGWFADTLSQAPIGKLAILRLDGDMYSSSIQTLEALYDKVSNGGYVIVDDYVLKACRQAVHDFRARRGISEIIQDIDGAGIYWRKVH